jgi:anti-sigma factor RsiW
VKHSEFRARLSEYLERDLIPEERARIETHLEGCADCTNELSELRSTVALLRRLPEPGHPAGLADAVLARIASEGQRPAPVRRLLRRTAEPRIAALLAAGFAGFLLLVQAGDRGLTPSGAPGAMQLASLGSRDAFGLPREFQNGLWDPEQVQPRAVRSLGAGILSNSLVQWSGAEYGSRAHIQEVARLLRGAGHPHSASLASHFDGSSMAVTAGWQPR